MKKIIAFIIPALNIGGAEKVTLSIIKNIDKKRYTPVLITMNSQGPLKNEIPSDVKLYDIDSLRFRYSVIRLMKLLKHLQPDCIFSTLSYASFIIIILKKLLGLRAKIIVRESSTVSCVLKQLPPYKARLFSLLYKKLYPIADMIIAQCENMKMDLLELLNINPEKIVRIYNPVDIDTVLTKANAFIPPEYKADELNLVATSRLVESKGGDILLKAFNRLLKYKPTAHLYIIGDGPFKYKMMSICQRLRLEQKVTFMGLQINPYPYVKNADLFILSSRFEGFPNSLLEALVCGAKVVATDCESGPREILGDEEYGLLAKVNDEKSLCRKMKEYLEIESKTGNRGSDFSIDKIIEQYHRVFDSVLSQGRPK